jgi:hypothetical protein
MLDEAINPGVVKMRLADGGGVRVHAEILSSGALTPSSKMALPGIREVRLACLRPI